MKFTTIRNKRHTIKRSGTWAHYPIYTNKVLSHWFVGWASDLSLYIEAINTSKPDLLNNAPFMRAQK